MTLRALCGLMLLLSISLAHAAESYPLVSESLVITHASRHYQTGPTTVAATLRIAKKWHAATQEVVALGQYAIATDPDWYGPISDVSRSYLSWAGEHFLYPAMSAGRDFHFTSIGGYHGACLGWTVAELTARFLEAPHAHALTVSLPMEAIFTGFLYNTEGQLVPATPEDESKADDSIDGMNLLATTKPMSDNTYIDFMMEMMKWGFFDKSPLWSRKLPGVAFELARNGRVLKTFSWKNATFAEAIAKPKQIVRLDYLTVDP